MKTLIDIDATLLNQARLAAGAKTKKETVTYALMELLRAKRRDELKQMIGHTRHGLTLRQLRAQR